MQSHELEARGRKSLSTAQNYTSSASELKAYLQVFCKKVRSTAHAGHRMPTPTLIAPDARQ